MSKLCMRSFDLGYQRQIMDEWYCLDYDLWINSHEISKFLYIEQDMKSLVWLSGQDEIDRPWYLRRLTQGMRCAKSFAKVVKTAKKICR